MLQFLLPIAFIPIILLLIWIRNTELNHRESWLSIVIIFVWGSTFAIIISLILENFINNYIYNLFILSILIAPIIEELIKPLGLRLIKSKIFELEDGFIYGAVAGFGFAATENLIYGARFWNQGFIVLLSLFYLRTVGTSFLHASTTSLIGFGYANKILKNKNKRNLYYYIIFAIGAHSLFNLLIFSTQILNHVIGIVIAVIFAILLIHTTRKRIQFLDKNQIVKKSFIGK